MRDDSTRLCCGHPSSKARSIRDAAFVCGVWSGLKPDMTNVSEYVMIAALVIERASVFVVSGFSRTCIDA